MKALPAVLLVLLGVLVATISPWLYMALTLAWLGRLQLTGAARSELLAAPDFPVSYHALPSFEAMTFDPKYFTLWTVGHWRAWVARQLAQKAGTV